MSAVVSTVSTVIARVVARPVVAAVIARLDAAVTAVVAGLGLAPTTLHLGRRQSTVDSSRLDLDVLTPVQRAEPGDVVKPRVGRDLDGRQGVAMLAVTDRERA